MKFRRIAAKLSEDLQLLFPSPLDECVCFAAGRGAARAVESRGLYPESETKSKLTVCREWRTANGSPINRHKLLWGGRLKNDLTHAHYTGSMAVRIAIPEPTSDDTEYNQRALPQYINALQAAGAEPVVIPLGESQERIAKLLTGIQGILLPGSLHDVDPQRYGEARAPECAADDPGRTAADELLLQDAFNLRKPILTICHGTQNLNVWRNGSLVQDLKTTVNHRPGREIVEAHPVRIAEGSRLTAILSGNGETVIEVNSSHHQAILTPGDNLRVTAISPGDGVVEAVELDAPDHFVVGVQWHPERTYVQSENSRAIFSALVQAALAWKPPEVPANRK
jgi:putative glutamine amidotransferase